MNNSVAPVTGGPSVLVDYLWLLSLSVLFGLSFTLTNIAVRDIPPLTLAAGRLFIAFLMLFPICSHQLGASGSEGRLDGHFHGSDASGHDSTRACRHSR